MITRVIAGAVLTVVGLGAQTSWRDFTAEDGSFRCRIPNGWNSRAVEAGGSTIYVLEAPGDPQSRILMGSAPTEAASIQGLAEQAIRFVTGEMLPGARPAGRPTYSQVNGMPSGEVRYTAVANGKSYDLLQLFSMKDGQFLALLSAGAGDTVPREIFRSMSFARPGALAGSGDVTRLLAGKWTYFTRGNVSHGTVSKQIVFYPNGRFQYEATSYVPGVDLPTGVDPTTRVTGTFKIVGTNSIQARNDNGQVATYTFELQQGGRVLKLGGDLFLRER